MHPQLPTVSWQTALRLQRLNRALNSDPPLYITALQEEFLNQEIQGSIAGEPADPDSANLAMHEFTKFLKRINKSVEPPDDEEGPEDAPIYNLLKAVIAAITSAPQAPFDGILDAYYMMLKQMGFSRFRAVFGQLLSEGIRDALFLHQLEPSIYGKAFLGVCDIVLTENILCPTPAKEMIADEQLTERDLFIDAFYLMYHEGPLKKPPVSYKWAHSEPYDWIQGSANAFSFALFFESMNIDDIRQRIVSDPGYFEFIGMVIEGAQKSNALQYVDQGKFEDTIEIIPILLEHSSPNPAQHADQAWAQSNNVYWRSVYRCLFHTYLDRVGAEREQGFAAAYLLNKIFESDVFKNSHDDTYEPYCDVHVLMIALKQYYPNMWATAFHVTEKEYATNSIARQILVRFLNSKESGHTPGLTEFAFSALYAAMLHLPLDDIPIAHFGLDNAVTDDAVLPLLSRLKNLHFPFSRKASEKICGDRDTRHCELGDNLFSWQLIDHIIFEHEQSLRMGEPLPALIEERIKRMVPFMIKNGASFNNDQLAWLNDLLKQQHDSKILGINGQELAAYIREQQYQYLLHEHGTKILDHFGQENMKFYALKQQIGDLSGNLPSNKPALNADSAIDKSIDHSIEMTIDALKNHPEYETLEDGGVRLTAALRQYYLAHQNAFLEAAIRKREEEHEQAKEEKASAPAEARRPSEMDTAGDRYSSDSVSDWESPHDSAADPEMRNGENPPLTFQFVQGKANSSEQTSLPGKRNSYESGTDPTWDTDVSWSSDDEPSPGTPAARHNPRKN